LGGAKRQHCTADIHAVAHINALSGRRGNFHAFTGPIRSRALSPFAVRALIAIGDIVTNHHILLRFATLRLRMPR
jgi:hypothetical protein